MTATNIFTNVLKEIYTRISTATGTGKKLSDLVHLYMGNRLEVTESNDCPSIVVQLNRIEEDYLNASSYQKKSALLFIDVHLFYAISNERGTNIYYDESTPPVGFLPYLEKVIDVLNETTSQSIDPRFNLNSKRSVIINSTVIKYTDQLAVATIALAIRTEDFYINGRYSI